jgi:hypothetical protein
MSQRSRTTSRDGDVIRRPETKSFILTSEFWVAAAAAAAVFLAGYALDDIAKTTAWRYGVWIAIAYIVSRGIAKAGSQRHYQPEPFADRSGNGSRRDGYRDDTDRSVYRDDMDRRERSVSGAPLNSADEPTQAYGQQRDET